VIVPRPGDSEETFSVFTATRYYQSNHLLVETIPLSALPKDTSDFRTIPLMLTPSREAVNTIF